METLRKIGNFFTRNWSHTPENDEPNTQDVVEMMQQQHHEHHEDESGRFALGTAEQPVEIGQMGPMPVNVPGVPYFERDPNIDYSLEFVNFMSHNAPAGFGRKVQKMLPFMGLSLFSWPSYWLWRGYQWQSRRHTEKITMYIQRTFQHAKMMQVIILSMGLFMATNARNSGSPLEVHEVSYDRRQPLKVDKD